MTTVWMNFFQVPMEKSCTSHNTEVNSDHEFNENLHVSLVSYYSLAVIIVMGIC